MADIFREVEEEIRHDRYKALWDRVGLYVVGGVVAVVLLTVIGVFYRSYSQSQLEAESSRFTEAQEIGRAGDDEAAAAEFGAIASGSGGGYALLARFQQAAALANSGRIDEAIGIYDSLANASEARDTLKDLARVKAALLLADKADYEGVRSRVTALAESTSAFRHTARELLAYADYETGAYDAAKAWYEQIVADPQAPTSLRSRAHNMISLLTPRTTNPLAAAPESSTGTGEEDVGG